MNNIFDNLLLISCILCIIVIVNNVVRKREHLDLIDTSDENPLVKELKKMKEGFDKLGNIVNVAGDGFNSALKELKNAFDKAGEELEKAAVVVKDTLVDAYEKGKTWLSSSCYRDEVQCYIHSSGKYVGNAKGVPYECTLGNNWVKNPDSEVKNRGEWKFAGDMWMSPYCERDFPNECSTGNKCYMKSR
jgi:hypothetical protein